MTSHTIPSATGLKSEVVAPNLVQKLAAVMAQVERIPKTGHNSFFNYDYATEADITDAVRAHMAAQGIMLVPSVEKVEWQSVTTKGGGNERLATLTVKFTVTDGVDRLEFNVLGEGQDRGDKATYKAMTGAMKYALLKLFLISTGDDPEMEEGDLAQQGAAKAKTGPHAVPAADAKPVAKPPPPYVAALWKRAYTEFKGTAKEKWEAAAEAALGETPPPSHSWTQEQAQTVEEILWPKDIPF